MEDYTTTWKPVFDAYDNYGNSNTSAKQLAEQIKDAKLMQALLNFKTHLPEIERYRGFAKELKIQPTNPEFCQELDSSKRKLISAANDIEEQCQIIMVRCEEVLEFIKIAATVIKESVHRKQLASLANAITHIIKGIGVDKVNYSPQRIQITLDEIRRNP